MACCAIAAFILCNIVLFMRRIGARVTGAPAGSMTKNAAVAWTFGTAPGARRIVPGRRGLRGRVLVALGLGFAASAIATIATHPIRHSAPFPVAQFLERADASICGSVRRLSGTDEHDDTALQEHQ
jgi:hypothetical protein